MRERGRTIIDQQAFSIEPAGTPIRGGLRNPDDAYEPDDLGQSKTQT
jgi:hypothetical protein